MSAPNLLAILILLGGVALGVWDISATQERTIVVYTTSALRDVLEKDIIPAFREETGHRVAPVYVAAGQQYNRLRMSGGHPEADLFVHASPLYLEKGYAEGRVAPLDPAPSGALDATFQSRAVPGGHVWSAFAWSPLVVVYPEETRAAPDLATTDAAFGFPHPLLSNNGVYVVLFLEATDPSVGERLLAQTRVQPTNARANIGGVADGSFPLTLGYEAVARFFEEQGARIAHDVPSIKGERVTTRVLFSVALIEGSRHPGAPAFARFLFSDEVQTMLARRDFRPVIEGAPMPSNAIPLGDARIIEYDWERWQSLELSLPRYEVKP